MPASILRCRGRVSEVVLLADFVRDAGGGRIDVARIPNDLRASAAVVGHVAECNDVDAFIAWPRSLAAIAAENLRPYRVPPAAGPPAAAGRKGKRDGLRASGNGRRRRPANAVVDVAVDADGVNNHLALPDLLFQLAHADMARRVVAIRDHDERFLLILSARRHRHGVGHGVVEGGSAFGDDAIEDTCHRAPVSGPPLQEYRRIAEPVNEHLIAFVEQIRQEPIERAARRVDLFAGHAATRVERDPEAHRHAFGAELGDSLPDIVFVDDEVVAREARDESTAGIGHRGGDVHELDTALEPERVRVLCGRLLAVERRDGEERGDDDRQRAKAVHHLRSTCGTTRSSVRKLTRYFPTSAAPGTVTTNFASVPG